MTKTTYEIIPFNAEACDKLRKTLHGFEIDTDSETYVKAMSQYPNTAFCSVGSDGSVLAAAGIMPLWKGVGEAWVLAPPSTNEHFGLYLHRAVTTYLDRIVKEYQLHRVQSAVLCDFITSHRWIKRLGFMKEGPLYCYGPDKRTFYRYAKIYPY